MVDIKISSNQIKNLRHVYGVSLESYGTPVQTSAGRRGFCYYNFCYHEEIYRLASQELWCVICGGL